MSQSSIGAGLVLASFALIGSLALDVIGGSNGGIAPFVPGISILFGLLGAGVVTDEIQFKQETAWKYEGLIFLFNVVFIMSLVVDIFIILS